MTEDTVLADPPLSLLSLSAAKKEAEEQARARGRVGYYERPAVLKKKKETRKFRSEEYLDMRVDLHGHLREGWWWWWRLDFTAREESQTCLILCGNSTPLYERSRIVPSEANLMYSSSFFPCVPSLTALCYKGLDLTRRRRRVENPFFNPGKERKRGRAHGEAGFVSAGSLSGGHFASKGERRSLPLLARKTP